ncbi:MAG TPA: DUF3828 domain-containing protein [Pyrinomonadaceae bacterium]|jgi:hypothetical protein|nr:DUF3828 domain-containing protein [Pyrinomonadaceae bacterium]
MTTIITTRHITLLAILTVCAVPLVRAQPKAAAPQTPDALVADLYKAQKLKRGPFFQTRSRALVDKYFTKSLGDLIWKDARTSKGEVGVIDGDPLYDAQDMEIKHFALAKSRREKGRALVDVTFENFGQKHTITYIIVKEPSGWRIDDIIYSEGRTLKSEFKDSR